MKKIKRPVLRYFGGKYKIADWIVDHFPEHKVYVEPFGGGASVLMRKKRSYAEVYNDLDNEVVNVFRVLRDPEKSKELERLVYLTPFARDEYEIAFQHADNDVEQARRSIIKTFLTHGSDSMNRKSGFRVNSNRSGAHPARDWMNYPQYISEFTERLRGVAIENRDAIEVILQHDSPDTLFYVDPPYVHSTRSRSGKYRFEMTDEDHLKLAEVLRSVKGKVIISGYSSDLYENTYSDWTKSEKHTFVNMNKPKTEIIYANFASQNQEYLFI
jgi:DNA adenine methylase